MIIQFSDLQKLRDYKKSVVMNFLIGYYMDIDIDSPYYIRANDMYKKLIHNYSDLKKYYEKIVCKKQNVNQR